MIVIYKCGDIVQNAFGGVKPSSSITMKIESQWYWGHCILIDKVPIEKWEQGQEFKFSGTPPNVDVANLGDIKHHICISLQREN